MKEKRLYNKIPVVLKESEFNEFVLPHLKKAHADQARRYRFSNYSTIFLNSCILDASGSKYQ